LPVNCVNWYEAYAFCIWDGGFLPSEAEWEYAAAGGSEELEYPWGSTAPGAGSQYAIYDCYYPDGTGSCGAVRNIAPVGTATLGVARWGQMDMGGEELGWNLDWYATYVDPCIDCAYVSPLSRRVVRGGSFDGNGAGLLPPDPFADFPIDRFSFIGIRCARTP
jgi:formylglycine-generating enzyme required for sulfatase activity